MSIMMKNGTNSTVNSVPDICESYSEELLKQCLSVSELRFAAVTDNHKSITSMTTRLSEASTAISAITVFPSFIETVGIALKNEDIAISALIGGYPVSHTYLEVKLLECAMAVENGADEIEIAMDMGEVVSQEREEAESEIALMQEEIGEDAILKVTVDNTLLKDESDIRDVAMSVMRGGAGFICNRKDYGSEFDIAIMCQSVKEYFLETGKRVGVRFSVDGSDVERALLYYSTARQILSDEWFEEKLVRLSGNAFVEKLFGRING